MYTQFQARCHAVSAEHGVRVQIREDQYNPPTPFDVDLVSKVRAGAQQRGLSVLNMPTGAGHDAVHMADVCPTAMIFVPCKDGISHNEIEDAKPEHLEAGCNVLLDAMVARDNG